MHEAPHFAGLENKDSLKRFDEISPVREGRAVARTLSGVYLVDEKGKEVAHDTFDGARVPSEGRVAVFRRKSLGDKTVQGWKREGGEHVRTSRGTKEIVQEKWYYVSAKDGQRLFEPAFTFDYAESFSNGRSLVEKDGQMYFLDTEGHLEEVHPNLDPSWEEDDPRYARSMEDGRKVLDWRGARKNTEDMEISVPLSEDQLNAHQLEGSEWTEVA